MHPAEGRLQRRFTGTLGASAALRAKVSFRTFFFGFYLPLHKQPFELPLSLDCN